MPAEPTGVNGVRLRRRTTRRLTVGGLMVVVALAAVGFAAFRPLSEARAIRIAREQVRRHRPDMDLSQSEAFYALNQYNGKTFAVVWIFERGRKNGVAVVFWDNSPRDPELAYTER